MKRMIFAALTLCTLVLSSPAFAQQITGNISGRITDDQSAALPGVTVTATNAETGYVRAGLTDGEGIYRLTGLPVGTYDITAELQGFTKINQKAIVLNVGQTLDIPITLKVAALAEAVEVRGETPLIERTSSSVGGVVDVERIESMPLNGRQFANAAITIPGVGLGFHSDPTKSTQYSPQIAGGNGRNVNYQIDGGDNNDDTVGGLLQLYPLEAIQEFNFVTQRYKAEYGRSNGGVMNIVTKSGTNQMRGSWFTNFRDESLNSKTMTEKVNNVGKQPYKRYQYGGSFGGPVVQNRAHFFVAAERTQQDTQQAVTTLGLVPTQDGVYPTPNRENLITGKVSSNITPNQLVAVRYGRNTNSQVYSAEPRRVPENWGDSANTFNSINLNHNWVLGGSKLNEFIFQYADFENHIDGRTTAPQQGFPNGVTMGYNTNTPQTTAQHKYQFRDDFSWHVTGKGGLGHDMKAGVNYIHEPKLYVTFSSGSSDYAYTHLTNDLNGPISRVTRNKPGASANLPMDQYGFYIQDDWRATSRLTINAGLRYDLVTGFLIDQSAIPNYIALTNAAGAGRFDGVPGFDEFGKKAQEDKNNWQPRVGGVYDIRGDGRDVVRAGWGVYYDYGFTNANILFPGLSAQGGSGVVFDVNNTAGIKNPDGSFFTVGQPISNIASLNEVNPNGPFYSSNVAAPQIRQPYTQQSSVGWSHEFSNSTVLDIDYTHSVGKDLGVRWPLNTRLPVPAGNGPRRYADLPLNPANPTMNMSIGSSQYDGINFGVRRRMTRGIQLNAWYTLSKATGRGGLAVDELTTNLVQDSFNPLGDVQDGPAARSDARHKMTISAILNAPWGITVAPVFRYRSALPMHIWYGYDNNLDGVSNDMYPTAYRFKSVDDAGIPSFEEMGTCETVNCGRGAPLSQFNFRVAKSFPLRGTLRAEVFGEVFNLFNAINPAFTVGAVSSAAVFTGTLADHTNNTVFMKPNAYAGDNGQPEQRVGQLGFRIVF
ncbi:MAG TPA: TonB-dependent receptor [Vicinamibacterales bacterium]|nr:TonB-dependent receptor [Vicinamibacterales bacterium]